MKKQAGAEHVEVESGDKTVCNNCGKRGGKCGTMCQKCQKGVFVTKRW